MYAFLFSPHFDVFCTGTSIFTAVQTHGKWNLFVLYYLKNCMILWRHLCVSTLITHSAWPIKARIIYHSLYDTLKNWVCMFGNQLTFVWMSFFVAMQTLQILKPLKLSINPPIAWAPRLSAEYGPMLPLNWRSWPSVSKVTPLSCKR